MSSLESELRDELNIVIMQLEGTTAELERLQKLARGLAQAIGFIQGGLDPSDVLIAKRVDPYLEYTDEIERLQKELEIYKDLYAGAAVEAVEHKMRWYPG